MRKALLEKKVGVLMGGISPERDISLKTGKAVLESLLNQGFDAVAIDPSECLIESLKMVKIDIAFIALHGEGGEDGVIQGFFESAGIPYTGSGVLSSAVSMDKNLSKIIFRASGIPTPDFFAVRNNAENLEKMMSKNKMKYPVIVKPSSGGSTIGITTVLENSMLQGAVKNALSNDDTAIVETFIEGRDLTVGMLGGEALPVIEMKPKSGFYDYDAKYKPGMTEYLCPAPISETENKRCREYSIKACTALDCKGAPRVDLRMDAEGNISVLEVNTIPGMTETSLLPMAAGKAGIDFNSLVFKILEGACEKKK